MVVLVVALAIQTQAALVLELLVKVIMVAQVHQA
jgi:hypothetical protein